MKINYKNRAVFDTSQGALGPSITADVIRLSGLVLSLGVLKRAWRFMRS